MLGTKAETLARLKPLLTQSRVLDLFFFTVRQWEQDQREMVDRIGRRFGAGPVVVRSSALGEDTDRVSMAGHFTSRLGVTANCPDEVRAAVSAVIASYPGGRDDQVLIQPQLLSFRLAGVVTSKDIATGAPYFVVSYDDSGESTSSVTSGRAEVSTVRVRRSAHVLRGGASFLAPLLRAVQEIEKLLERSDLDVEFAQDASHDVTIFQVRALAKSKTWCTASASRVVKASARLKDSIASLISRRDPELFGSTTAFSNMSDWNPAEMLGVTPRPLAVSLYRRLITRRAWRDARRWVGYEPAPCRDLIVMLSGRPYIDIRLSLNSFLPRGLDEACRSDLVDRWIARLTAERANHDKIEFAVATTCLDFARSDELLIQRSLCGSTRSVIDSLRALTNRALDLSGRGSLAQAWKALAPFEVANWTRLLEVSQRDGARRIQPLLDLCEKHGTRPFAVLARHAFIAESLLRSACERGALSPERVAAFKRSLSTVSRRLSMDAWAVQDGSMSIDEFLSSYGHLRPSTYDISSLPLSHRDPAEIVPAREMALSPPQAFELTAAEARDISLLLKETGLIGDAASFCRYAGTAIAGREYGKFLFTRGVNEALEAVAHLGSLYGLSREDCAYLDIEDLISRDARSWNARRLAAAVNEGRRSHEIARSIALPSAIFSPDDIDVVIDGPARPTFVGTDAVCGDVIVLSPVANPGMVSGRIVAVEQADPGYDWIFLHGPVGLVTRFGGANSHMAIRCVEQGISAAIGCGERVYRTIAGSKRVRISPGTQELIGLDVG